MACLSSSGSSSSSSSSSSILMVHLRIGAMVVAFFFLSSCSHNPTPSIAASLSSQKISVPHPPSTPGIPPPPSQPPLPPPQPKSSTQTPIHRHQDSHPKASNTPRHEHCSSASNKSSTLRERGKTAGIALSAVAGLLQVALVAFLFLKRKQMLKMVRSVEDPSEHWNGVSAT